MKLKVRSEGTPINSEIYAESLAGTEGSASAQFRQQYSSLLLTKRIDLIPLTAYS
jgi:hypothetical protein